MGMGWRVRDGEEDEEEEEDTLKKEEGSEREIVI